MQLGQRADRGKYLNMSKYFATTSRTSKTKIKSATSPSSVLDLSYDSPQGLGCVLQINFVVLRFMRTTMLLAHDLGHCQDQKLNDISRELCILMPE